MSRLWGLQSRWRRQLATRRSVPGASIAYRASSAKIYFGEETSPPLWKTPRGVSLDAFLRMYLDILDSFIIILDSCIVYSVWQSILLVSCEAYFFKDLGIGVLSEPP